MALPGVEITITLDSIDAETQSSQPQIVLHGAQNAGHEQEKERKNHHHQQLQIQQQGDSYSATEQSQEQLPTQQGHSSSTRPKLLPFLSEIKNRQPRQTGMFKHITFPTHRCSYCSVILIYNYVTYITRSTRAAFFAPLIQLTLVFQVHILWIFNIWFRKSTSNCALIASPMARDTNVAIYAIHCRLVYPPPAPHTHEY